MDQFGNIPNACVRMRLNFGGEEIEDSAIFTTLYSKLNAEGLVYNVSGGSISATGETNMDSESSGYGQTTIEGSSEISVSKVGEYSSYFNNSQTMVGYFTFYTTYIDDEIKIVKFDPSTVLASRTYYDNSLQLAFDIPYKEPNLPSPPFVTQETVTVKMVECSFDLIRLL